VAYFGPMVLVQVLCVILPPAPEPRWPKDEECHAAGEAERGWVDAALKSRESPAAVAQLALLPHALRKKFTRGLDRVG
jgi:hypothetical protein